MKSTTEAQQLEHDHATETARIHVLLLQDAAQGLADVEAGRFTDAKPAPQNLKARRAKGTLGNNFEPHHRGR